MDASSISEFLGIVFSLKHDGNATTFFRGHNDARFKSLPKVFRDIGWESQEHLLIRNLVEMHPEAFSNDLSTLEKLVRAQHFGLPTRLLDVTLNPLVALYFCCCEKERVDGEVLVYNVRNDRVKSHDSDTVSILANLSLLDHSEKVELYGVLKAHFNKTKSLKPSEFNRKMPIPRLHHFICGEKPYFQPNIRPHTLRQYVVVLPKRSNRRMIAQAGAFIVFGQGRALSDSVSPAISVTSIKIPAPAKRELKQRLDILNIHRGALFPDVAQASEYLAGKYALPF